MTACALNKLCWERVSADGLRAIESLDEWLIARNRVMGVTTYTLWHNHEWIGRYDRAQDAMDAAEALRKT